MEGHNRPALGGGALRSEHLRLFRRAPSAAEAYYLGYRREGDGRKVEATVAE